MSNVAHVRADDSIREAPSLDQMLARLNTCLPRCGPQLNAIVAEEEYTRLDRT